MNTRSEKQLRAAEGIYRVYDHALDGLMQKVDAEAAIVQDVTLDPETREAARLRGLELLPHLANARDAALTAYCEFVWLLPEVSEPTQKGR